jgi:type IV pilus assembly protein PilA
MTEENTSVDQRKPEGDLSYLAGWLCGIPLFGLVGALDYLCREMYRKAFQALFCGLLMLGVYFLFSSLMENEPVWTGRLIIIGAWIILPPVTLYYLRTLEWPAPAPFIKVGRPLWVGAVHFLVVIAILAAIAASALRDYRIRAKVWEANDEAKQRVEKYVRANQKLPATDADIGDPIGYANKYIESLSVGENGVITFRLTALVDTGGVFHESVAGKTVILTPHLNAGAVTWPCAGGTLPDKYRPLECRQMSTGP